MAAPQGAEDATRAGLRPRVLCCIWGELRGVFASAQSFRDCVLEPLDADVVILAQRQLPDDDERVKFLQGLFGRRLTHCELYDKPAATDALGGAPALEAMKQIRGNWLNAGNSQVLANHHRLGELLERAGFVEAYEMFVSTRSDLLHLLPFPDPAQLLGVLGPLDILTQAGHEFGGLNYNLAIMRREVVAQYMRVPCEEIAGRAQRKRRVALNIESCFQLLLETRGWRSLRMPVTCFITADALSDRSTWKQVRASAQRGVLFKYEPQMQQAYSALERWRCRPGWQTLCPPRRLQVDERHGKAVCPFALCLLDDAPACAGQGFSLKEGVRFHVVPRKGWDGRFRRLGCEARNVLSFDWSGQVPPPPTKHACWLLPAGDHAAWQISTRQLDLRAAGWKVLSCDPETLLQLSDKERFRAHAEDLGLRIHVPVHYASTDDAVFPCVLKLATGESGDHCHIVASKEEAETAMAAFAEATQGGAQWVLQELVRGRFEYAASLLVHCGEVLQVLGTEYEHAREVYVLPREKPIGSREIEVPQEHVAIMRSFLQGYSGFCNFNYKVLGADTPPGELCILEVNTKLGSDLARAVNWARARKFLETLDQIELPGLQPEEASEYEETKGDE